MRVFVSWSGDLSRRVAEILRNYLPLALQGLDVFMSKHDLESGGRWGLDLARELEQSSFGILCLTPDNLQSAWLLFEAGALAKHVEGRACGMLINSLKPTDVTGPLAQFQHRAFSAEGVGAILRDMNARLEKPLEQLQVEQVHTKWWPDIERDYQIALTSSANLIPPSPRDQRDILEEILSRIRSLERAVSVQAGQPFPRNLRTVIEASLALLTESQYLTLREIAYACSRGENIPAGRYSDEDILPLVAHGFLHKADTGFAMTHRLITEFLTQSSSQPNE
jgi:hypothetical protein